MGVSTDHDTVLAQVLELLQARSPIDAPLKADSMLRESVLLDSLQALELVIELEEAFDVTFKRPDMDRLDSPQHIAELILSKRSAG